MDVYLVGALRWLTATLLFCSAIRKTVPFRISKRPPSNVNVVLGVNSNRVRLEWLYSDAPSSYFVQFWKEKPGTLEQLSTNKNGTAFYPNSTIEFEALLPATLILKNVQRNDDYTYSMYLMDSSAIVVESSAVALNVVVPPEISDLPEASSLLTIGENNFLTCNASGDPLPNITWTKDGIPEDKFKVTGYHLHLNNVNLEDVGSYRCTARNGYGDDATAISIVGIRCDDCEIRMVGVTLKNEVWRSALNNRSGVEFKTLESKLLSEISSIFTKNPGKQLYTVSLLSFSRPDSSAAIAVLRLKFTDPLKPLEDEILKGKLGSLTVGRELELPSATGKPTFPCTNAATTAVPLTRSTASGFPEVTNQSEDRKKHQNMLRNHAIYLTIIFLLVVIIIGLVLVIWRGRNKQGFTGALKQTGNLKYHCREDQIDIQVQETPMEVQLTECTNVQGYLLSDYDQSPSLQSANTLHEQTLVSSDYMPLDQSTKLRNWEIRREQVHIIKMIGKGAFSQKMLLNQTKDLLSELEVMKILKPHPHVIKLMGCVTNSDPLLVLIEYIPYGDLLGYLRKSRGLNDTYFKDPDVKPETNLTAEQLVRFSCQIADGMRYLSSNKIIHRDLAARNVLVGEGEECKVTDFGMARNVHQDDIYTIHSGGRLPAKWTAYEGLLYGTYTTQSDV